MEILPVNDLDIALHNFVNKDDKLAFYSCVQYNIDETRVSIPYCIYLLYAFLYCYVGSSGPYSLTLSTLFLLRILLCAPDNVVSLSLLIDDLLLCLNRTKLLRIPIP